MNYLHETNLWHIFCWHFKNNLRKVQRVLNPPYLKHTLVWETGIKGLQFNFQISVNVLRDDSISMICIAVPKLFY